MAEMQTTQERLSANPSPARGEGLKGALLRLREKATMTLRRTGVRTIFLATGYIEIISPAIIKCDRFVRNGEDFAPDEDRVKQYSRDIANAKLLQLVVSGYRKRKNC